MRYADAGVNILAADEAKRRIAAMAGKTFRRGVLAPIGGFGSLFHLDRKRWRDPVLVSSTDGVGTKLKVACATGDSFRPWAPDIVNHCVNDILTQETPNRSFFWITSRWESSTRACLSR